MGLFKEEFFALSCHLYSDTVFETSRTEIFTYLFINAIKQIRYLVSDIIHLTISS